jgi:hypothetical protein
MQGLIGRLRGIREFIGRASGRVKNNTCECRTQRWGGMGWDLLALALVMVLWANDGPEKRLTST